MAGWWLFAPLVGGGLAAEDRTTLRFAHFGTYEDYELWGRIIAAYRVRRPEIVIRQEFVPGWYGAYETKLRQQQLAGQAPELMLVQSMSYLPLADMFENLEHPPETSPLSANQFHPTAIAAFQSAQGLSALPVSGGNLLLFCNLDALERAAAASGEPISLPRNDWTIEEFRSLAEMLTRDFDGDGQLDQFGFWLPQWVYYLPFLWSFGAEVFDEPTTHWRLYGPDAEAALSFYQCLFLEPRVCPRPTEIAQMVQDVGFLTGKVAMCVNGPWFQPFLEKAQLADRVVVLDIPHGPGGRWTRVTWDGVAVAKSISSARRETALDFMRFLFEPEIQLMLANDGRAIPARRDVASKLDAQTLGKLQPFLSAMSYSRLQSRTPHFSKLDAAINQHLRSLFDLQKPISPSEALQELADDSRILEHFEITP